MAENLWGKARLDLSYSSEGAELRQLGIVEVHFQYQHSEHVTHPHVVKTYESRLGFASHASLILHGVRAVMNS